jgi:2-methylcitrate dehydratase PrpD
VGIDDRGTPSAALSRCWQSGSVAEAFPPFGDIALNATERIAHFIATTRYQDVPAPVLAASRTIILDGIANVLAGSTQSVSEHVRRYVDRLGGRPECTVVGAAFKTNPPLAAFANGAAMHVLDYEPQGIPSTHGTSTLLPGIVALAEVNGASGRALLTAFAVGWEIQQRIAMAARRAESRPFHPPGIYGPPASAAACANLLSLDEHQTRMALGIGASRTGALFANNGTMTKCTHPGNSTRMGVEAALLAADGFTANDAIFETERGYVETIFGGEFDWDALLDGLGSRWNLAQHGFNIKRYPAQIAMQWATEAVVLLKEKNGIRADDVEWLELEVSSRRPGLSRPAPATGLDGKFSFEYVAAVALTQEQVGIDSFSDAVRFSAPVEAALKKIRLKPNPDISTSTLEQWAQARAGLKDGRVLVERCDAYRGSSRNPIGREAHLVKVRDCMRRVLAEPAMERLIALVEQLDDLADAGVLARALVGE